MRGWQLATFLCGTLACSAALGAAPDAEGIEFFEKKIRPALVAHCYECHSSQAKELEGSLSLETRAGTLKGGDLGPAIVPGDPDNSLLMQAIRWQDKDLQMPPEKQLPAEVVAEFEAWIKRGAPDPRAGEAPAVTASKYVVNIEEARGRWPYTPVVEPPVPRVKDAAWPFTAIDNFVLAKLEAQNLTPVADADKRTWLRRVTYDLVGLPPSPEDIDAFLADESADAHKRVVERLLASPHYGERWGRHWLDVARYADTAGDNSDYPIPQMYRYRNWVIDAFNADKPYDAFIREQLAGDLLTAKSEDQRQQNIVATGYLANARRFGSRVDDYPQHLTIEDTIDNLGRAFLGLTINCARCHHHKFDPITTEDYYALYGIFHSTRYPWPGIELDKKQRNFVPLAPAAEVARVSAERKRQQDASNAAVKEAEKQKGEAEKAFKELEKRYNDARQAKSDQAAAIEQQKNDARSRFDAASKALESKKRERDALNNSPLPYPDAYAVADASKIENVKVQLKGDPEKPGALAPRGIPRIFGGQTLPAEESGSGRKQLADWLASPENPLTARVMVNRLWHYHFGRGIVPTPNDFGRQGKPATHPELLDFLAARFVQRGWSIKAMHREMVLSRTYRLASNDDAKAMAVDPGNDLLWRYNRRRLDAESIRDATLLLSGNLDPTPAREPHPFPPMNKWDFTQHNPFKAVYPTNRRSVYLMTQRIQRHPYLAIFDGPDTGASTGYRITSTTTLQALYLLNDEFVHEQAEKLAARLVAARKNDNDRLEHAYLLCFARPPESAERDAALAHLDKLRAQVSGNDAERTQEAWRSLARVLLRTNEFVYVD